MKSKENKIKTWSVSRYLKEGWLTDEEDRPNKNDIKYMLKEIGFDSIREFNNASKHSGYSINKQLQDKLISIFDISKPSSFDEIMIYKSWYGLENDIKFPFELSPNASEQSIFIRDCCIEKINNKETSYRDIYYFYIRAAVSHSSFLQARKDSFNEICTLLVRVKPSKIDQLTKNDFDIIKSYLYEETGNSKLVDNEDLLKDLFQQVYDLPERIGLCTKVFLIDEEEKAFFLISEEESISITADF
tara:strand:- start:91 stop:825 length:735 start_codon:yes stop_codon:yes gene_type:complete